MTQAIGTAESELLATYATQRSAEAFAELVHRYAGLVYAVGWRITRNRADAEDVAQESFLQLAANAGRITQSLPAWLHAAAQSRAVDVIRRRTTRQRYEQQALRERESRVALNEWDAISRHVDEAIARLPDEFRIPLIGQYFHNQTQAELAESLGISQGTISRRIERAVEMLREHLQQAGVEAPSLAVLGTLLADHGTIAASPALVTTLSKIGLAGVGGTVSSGAGAGLLAKLVVPVAAIVVLLAGGIVLFHRWGAGAGPMTTSMTPTANRPLAISFRGDINRQDSFSLAMVAVAEHFGRRITYEQMYILSGNCFAPDIRPDEPERAFWAFQGRGRNLDLVCARLGLRWRAFPAADELAEIPPMPSDPAAKAEWIETYYRKPAVPLVREAIARGDLVVSMGEWVHTDDVCWTEWGIFTRADDDATILGAASNERSDNTVDFVRDGFVVSPGAVTLSAEGADREILRRAIARIGGGGRPPFDPGDRQIVFGLTAMDAWIQSMDQVPFCPMCGDRSPSCAASIALPMIGGGQAASSYLRDLAGRWGSAAGEHLLAAAAHYERIVALIEPSVSDDPARGYESIINDIARQRDHAQQVLVPIRAELAAAGDEMAAALGARPLPESAQIDGLQAREADTSPYPQGLSIILQHLGREDATYTRIMGYSGMAFVTLMDLRGPISDGEYDMAWWPNDSTPFELRLGFLAAAFGRDLRKVDDVDNLHATDPQRLYREQFEPVIMRSIVAGRPVLATNDAAYVITGYDHANTELRGLWPSPGQPFYGAKTLYPWGLIVPGEAILAMSQTQAEIESLKWAIALGEDTAVASVLETAPPGWMAREPGREWSATLLTGQKSYAKWIAWLKGNDKLGARAWDANMVVHLRYNREAAVAYLRDIAPRHGAEAAVRIRTAADLYQQVLDLLSDIPMSWQFPDSQEHKQQYTQTIERVAQLEAQAIGELRLAVNVMPTTQP